MKVRLVILIFSEVIIGYLMLAAPAFHDRKDLARAVAAYQAARSPKSETELTRQRRITRQQQRSIFTIFGLILVANSYALVHTWRQTYRVHEHVA